MSVETENIAVIVSPIDTYTSEKEIFINEISDSIDNQVHTIYVDCEKLSNITSSHVSLLWEAMQMCQENSILFKLRNVSKEIIDVFKVLDLADFFVLEHDNCSSAEANQLNKIALLEFIPYESKFCPNVENIVREKFSLDKHLKKTNITHSIIYEIETIFYEVVTNIRRHGQLKPIDTISFFLNQMNDSLTLQFIDNGLEFDLTKHDANFNPQQAMKDRLINGLGIIMIKKMASSILYERIENKNNLIVTKTWGVK